MKLLAIQYETNTKPFMACGGQEESEELDRSELCQKKKKKKKKNYESGLFTRRGSKWKK